MAYGVLRDGASCYVGQARFRYRVKLAATYVEKQGKRFFAHRYFVENPAAMFTMIAQAGGAIFARFAMLGFLASLTHSKDEINVPTALSAFRDGSLAHRKRIHSYCPDTVWLTRSATYQMTSSLLMTSRRQRSSFFAVSSR